MNGRGPKLNTLLQTLKCPVLWLVKKFQFPIGPMSAAACDAGTDHFRLQLALDFSYNPAPRNIESRPV